jgi:hypothetical protein
VNATGEDRPAELCCHDFSVRTRYRTYSELLAATDLVIEKELGTDVKDGQVPPPPTGHQGADRLPAGHRAKRDTRPAFSMCTAV